MLKLTTWNIEWLNRLVGAANPGGTDAKAKRLAAIAAEIREIDPDVMCIGEGPKGEAKIRAFATDWLADDWRPVLRGDDKAYETGGEQWIWFLVKPAIAPIASLLPIDVWRDYTEGASAGEHGATWEVYYGNQLTLSRHEHYRHPQVLVLDWQGTRVEVIGAHLKSKHNIERWNGTFANSPEYVAEAIKARAKLSSEASDIRFYIDRRFSQEADPPIFVVGDLNDGPGKEKLERLYLLHDLLGNVQGDVFFARQFLNHALFDYPEALRWTVNFNDPVDPGRDPHFLLDHIMFTQRLVRSGVGPLHIGAGAGLVEREIHDRINATLSSKNKTSDHYPVSVRIATVP